MTLADGHVCVLMCMLSYVTSADSRVVAVAVLATLLSLMAAGVLVFLKRKTLVRLVFTNKKTTMEKLRFVGSTRTTSPSQTQSMYRTQHKLPGAIIYKPSYLSSEPLLPPHSFHSHSLRQLPHPPLHISNPMPVSLSVGQQALLPLPPDHRDLPTHSAFYPLRAPHFHSLPRQEAYRVDQDYEKPSPPQKPLPADPRGKTVAFSSSVVGVRLPGPLPTPTLPRALLTVPYPNRPAPMPPLRLPKTHRSDH
ncbi:hypothetical protein UPYG_G00324360 [Umbra pygmaea]|uniref:Uncharacterized protein n=1 Tax=Umbra pygmaea TaxID=75934 RepID=A0ABD0W5N7_UMBPY